MIFELKTKKTSAQYYLFLDAFQDIAETKRTTNTTDIKHQ